MPIFFRPSSSLLSDGLFPAEFLSLLADFLLLSLSERGLLKCKGMFVGVLVHAVYMIINRLHRMADQADLQKHA